MQAGIGDCVAGVCAWGTMIDAALQVKRGPSAIVPKIRCHQIVQQVSGQHVAVPAVFLARVAAFLLSFPFPKALPT